MFARSMKILVALLVSVAAVTPNAQSASAAAAAAETITSELLDATASERERSEAQDRMTTMFHDVRRLAFSYDFEENCVSSLSECVEDSNCAADEECYFLSASRKKRQLAAGDASAESREAKRSLLFGSNSVGQCVCL